jgi:zinc transport system ATP-binding protein
MKTLLGLKTAHSGSVIYGEGLKNTEIGYLPQQTAAQRDFPASVYEVVLSGCLNKASRLPFFRAEHKKLARKNIEKLGLTELSGRCYRELSGGQQQRVLLARALCASSELLLLDEPVSGLDPIVTNELYGIIEKLNKDGMTVIMISHDISAAVNYATHILHLANTPLFYGKTEDYLSSDVGRALQAPTCCTCIPLLSPLLTTARASTPKPPQGRRRTAQKTNSIAPAVDQMGQNTVPRVARTSAGITPPTDGSEEDK